METLPKTIVIWKDIKQNKIYRTKLNHNNINIIRQLYNPPSEIWMSMNDKLRRRYFAEEYNHVARKILYLFHIKNSKCLNAPPRIVKMIL